MKVFYFTLLICFILLQIKCSSEEIDITPLAKEVLAGNPQQKQHHERILKVSTSRSRSTSSRSSSSGGSASGGSGSSDPKVVIIIVCCTTIPLIFIIAITIYCRRKRIQEMMKKQQEAQKRLENNMANAQQTYGMPAYPQNQYVPPGQPIAYGQPMFNQSTTGYQNFPSQVTINQQPYGGYPPKI